MTPCALTFAAMIEARPTSALRTLIRLGHLGRGGNVGAHVVIGCGVEGRGETRNEAALAWADGVRRIAGGETTLPQAQRTGPQSGAQGTLWDFCGTFLISEQEDTLRR